jgi:thiol-disulfide isomerase/thioredoxin
MQRYSNSATTKITVPEIESPHKCAMGGINNILTYILVFFLVLLICYSIIYVYRIYTQNIRDEEKFGNSNTNRRNSIVGLFWTNCGHCKRFKPIFESVMSEMNKSEAFTRDWSVKTIEDTEVAKNMYKITSFPAVVVIKNDQVVETKVGGMDEKQFRDFVKKHVQ